MPGWVSNRRALWWVFFLNGIVLASWAPRIPTVKTELGLTHFELGIALLGIAIGSTPTLLITGRLLKAVPAATLCRLSGLVLAAGFPLIAMAVDMSTLMAVLILLGAASGMLDIAMNAAAVEWEHTTGRTTLPALHGAVSIGVLTGAGCGTLAAGQLNLTTHFALVTAVALILIATVWKAIAAPGHQRHLTPETQNRRGPVPTTLIVFALCALLIEGIMIDWSAVLIREEHGGSATLAAAGVTVFSTGMAISRTLGDRLVARFGIPTVCRVSTLLVAVTLTAGLLQPSPLILLATLGLIGVGCGPLFPLAISTATAGAGDDVGRITAWISAWGYLAFLTGPPTIGALADHLGLTRALLLVGATAAITLATLSSTINQRRNAQPQKTGA